MVIHSNIIQSILSRIGAADYGSGAMSRSAHVGNGRGTVEVGGGDRELVTFRESTLYLSYFSNCDLHNNTRSSFIST